MECIYKERIQETVFSVRTLSFDEKKSPLNSEEEINSFLDSINEFRALLIDKSLRINEINERLRLITWYNDLDEECLMLVNDIISLGKDLRTSLIRQYIKMDFLRKKGIAKEEIKNLKNAIDDLKEGYDDLESVFFYLPSIPDFKETTRLLSLI